MPGSGTTDGVRNVSGKCRSRSYSNADGAIPPAKSSRSMAFLEILHRAAPAHGFDDEYAELLAYGFVVAIAYRPFITVEGEDALQTRLPEE